MIRCEPLFSTGYGAIADHVRLAEIADPVAGSGEVLIEIHAASLNPIDFKLVRGDLKRGLEIQIAATVRLRCQRHRDIGGRRCYQVQAGRRGLRPCVARHHRHFAEQIALPEKFVALKPADHFARRSRVAAAGGADHAAGFCAASAHAPASAS